MKSEDAPSAGSEAQASVAANYLSANVNERTGQLHVHITPPRLPGLGSLAVDLGVQYAPGVLASDRSVLGLPHDWTYPLSYILENRIFIDGAQSYVLAPHAASGMQYYKLEDRVLKTFGEFEQPVFPYDPSRRYASALCAHDGGTQYFDAYGRLMGVDDRYGNHILYYYDQASVSVLDCRLGAVVDVFGQRVDVHNGQDSIRIAFPAGGANEIAFEYALSGDGSQLVAYTDPIGRTTAIEYHGGLVRDDLISRIGYPTGLTRSYAYATIEYLDAAGATAQRDVVSETTDAWKGSTRTTRYAFRTESDNHNYLGFPNYKTAPHTDTLFASNDNAYTYASVVSDGVTVVERTFNHLHLQISQKVTAADGGRSMRSIDYAYPGEGGDRHFPPVEELPANFQLPAVVATTYLGAAGASRTARKVTARNDYGQVTEQTFYDEPNGDGGEVALKRVTSTFDPTFGVLLSRDVADYTATGTVSSTAAVIRTENTLSADRKTVASRLVGSVSGEDGEAFHAEKATAFTYDASGRVVSALMTWAEGAGDRPGVQSSELKYAYAYDADSHRRTSTRTDAWGQKVERVVDSTTGFLLQRSTSRTGAVRYTHDDLGRKSSRRDAVGRLTTWSYDDAALVVTQTLANGYATSTRYNGFGDIVARFDNGGPGRAERVHQTRAYDDAGRISSLLGVLGKSSKLDYSYDSDGLVAATLDALGNTVTYDHDPVLRTRATKFNGVPTKTEWYDSRGKVNRTERFSAGSGENSVQTLSLHDGRNRIVYTQAGSKDAGSEWRSQTSVYGTFNRLDRQTLEGWDGTTSRRSFERDLLGNVLCSHRVNSAPEGPTYSSASATLEYNAAGMLMAEVLADGKTRRYGYDADGHNITITDFSGGEVQREFYADGKLKSESYADTESTPQKIEYEYDAATGAIRSVSSTKSGAIVYDYELDGRLASITYPDGRTLKWSYDQALNRLESFSDVDATPTRYGYDAFGRLATVASEGEEISLAYLTAADNAAASGQLASLGFADGTSVALGYDGFNSVCSETTLSPERAEILSLNYRFDPASRFVKSLACCSTADAGTAVNATSTYRYDGIGRLCDETVTDPAGRFITSSAYRYDAADNVVEKTVDTSGQTAETTYTYDDDNRLISFTESGNEHRIEYDANGNVVRDAAGNTYEYDALNRLVAYVGSDGVATAYDYYANGQRSSKTRSGGTAIRYYYDGSKLPRIVNEIEGDASASYLVCMGRRFRRRIKNGTTLTSSMLLRDRTSTRLVVDQAGAPERSYGYEAYGRERTSSEPGSEPRAASSSIADNPFKYDRQYQDAESGLYQLRSRYYDPRTMRFMSRDTTLLFNRYAFANGNPVMKEDDSGHTAWWNWLLDALLFIGTTLLTFVSFGTAAPAAVGADVADLGASAADAGLAAADIAGTATAAEVGGATSAADLAGGALGSDVEMQGFGASMGGYEDTVINPNGLGTNCVFCTAGYEMGVPAPDVAASLDLPEGPIATNDEAANVFHDLGLTTDRAFTVDQTADEGRLFDFMRRSPAGTRYALQYRVNDNWLHWINAESNGPLEPVSLYDAQQGRVVFGTPNGSTPPEYRLIRFAEEFEPHGMDLSN